MRYHMKNGQLLLSTDLTHHFSFWKKSVPSVWQLLSTSSCGWYTRLFDVVRCYGLLPFLIYFGVRYFSLYFLLFKPTIWDKELCMHMKYFNLFLFWNLVHRLYDGYMSLVLVWDYWINLAKQPFDVSVILTPCRKMWYL